MVRRTVTRAVPIAMFVRRTANAPIGKQTECRRSRADDAVRLFSPSTRVLLRNAYDLNRPGWIVRTWLRTPVPCPGQMKRRGGPSASCSLRSTPTTTCFLRLTEPHRSSGGRVNSVAAWIPPAISGRMPMRT